MPSLLLHHDSNAVTFRINRDLFMITIILLYEIDLKDEKIGRIFDFIDVNKEGHLTYNQMASLPLCIVCSFLSVFYLDDFNDEAG